MDYKNITAKINSIQNRNCFKKPEDVWIDYLKSLQLPEDVLEFYGHNDPIDIIEVNGVRLLPIFVIKDENINYTPGYLLSPHGYCVIATTINGDTYCVKGNQLNYSIVIASHDEIYEGQTIEEMGAGTNKIADSFAQFLNYYVDNKLVISFYDSKK